MTLIFPVHFLHSTINNIKHELRKRQHLWKYYTVSLYYEQSFALQKYEQLANKSMKSSIMLIKSIKLEDCCVMPDTRENNKSHDNEIWDNKSIIRAHNYYAPRIHWNNACTRNKKNTSRKNSSTRLK